MMCSKTKGGGGGEREREREKKLQQFSYTRPSLLYKEHFEGLDFPFSFFFKK